ncbi:MAG TPA: biotin transporter BioY [Firmicutes bacterium]|jgi:biotin transport system substrate-specific component|nr:biotin transporter BioY [Bacillota bacterium]
MLPIKKLVLSSLFAALIALLAQISIPLPFSPVPITGQAFGIFLVGSLLEGKWSAISVLIYILLGATGLPVFHQFQGGLHILVGPTGGFLWGFVLGCYLQGKIMEKGNSFGITILGMFTCMGAYFALGAPYMAFVSGLNFYQAILLGVVPFIPLDIVKLIAAATLSQAVRKRLAKAGL